MVLESLTNPVKAEKHPLRVFIIGAVYATIALFLGRWVFEDHASLIMVFLTVYASVPLFYSTMAYEESKTLAANSQRELIKGHGRAFIFFTCFFLGLVTAFTVWYLVLPASTSTSLFSVQSQTISNLNQQITGNAAQPTVFIRIFLNNLKVLIFSILFAFLYGAGSIFILTWNASVIGAAMGNFIRTNLAVLAEKAGYTAVGTYLYVVSLSILRYFVHGIPEILAYFIAALAGGIISIAIIKHDLGTKHFEKILLDASDLVVISVFVLFVAGLIEVYITPLFF